jgi:hypothetical protein
MSAARRPSAPWRRFWRSTPGLASAGALIALYIMALLAPFLAPYDSAAQHPALAYQPPQTGARQPRRPSGVALRLRHAQGAGPGHLRQPLRRGPHETAPRPPAPPRRGVRMAGPAAGPAPVRRGGRDGVPAGDRRVWPLPALPDARRLPRLAHRRNHRRRDLLCDRDDRRRDLRLLRPRHRRAAAAGHRGPALDPPVADPARAGHGHPRVVAEHRRLPGDRRRVERHRRAWPASSAAKSW